jgi:hypothetical protein
MPMRTLVILATFVLLGFTGLMRPERYNLLDATEILEVVVLVTICTQAVFMKRHREIDQAIALLVIWTAARLIWSFHHSPAIFADFAMAHKWIVLVVAILLCVGMPDVLSGRGPWLTKALLTLFLVKYFESRVFKISGGWPRPGLYAENNFELFLLLGLVAVFYFALGKNRMRWLLALFIIVGLSGSRSAAIGLIIVLLYLAYESAHRKQPVFMIGLFVMLGILAGISTFRQRGTGDLDSVDRVRFFDLFVKETADWGWVHWLFGNEPLTPLSHYTCSQLSYWESLFSFSGDGNCYSVILHSFAMRIALDFGLIGVLVVVLMLALAFRKGQVRCSLAITLAALALANSMSVSSLNSIYVCLPIMLSVMNYHHADSSNTAPPRSSNAEAVDSLRTTNSRAGK